MPTGIYIRKTGYKLSEAHKKSLSLAKLGKPRPDLVGRKRSPEAKLKMALAKIGYIPWNKGKPYYAIRGNKHFAWKGNTPLKRSVRLSLPSKLWKRAILARDNFSCQKCYKRGGDLEVDHYPVSFIEIFERNKISSLEQAEACLDFWDVNNGRTLCKKCHNKTKHGYIRHYL